MMLLIVLLSVLQSCTAFVPLPHTLVSTRQRTAAARVCSLTLQAEPAAGDKRVRKLKNQIKRITQLRRQDYLNLNNDQRQKLHGEPDVLRELSELIGGQEAEELRQRLQPGLDRLPRPQPWSKERQKEMEAEKDRLKAFQPVYGERAGDWECPQCGVTVFATKSSCFRCRTLKPGTVEADSEKADAKKTYVQMRRRMREQ